MSSHVNYWMHLSILQYADSSSMQHQHSTREPLQLPSQISSSESPSLSPQPPQPPPTFAAGLGAPLSAAISSASQPLPQNNPTEEQVAAGQKPMQEQHPQLWPLGGGALVAAPQATGQILSASALEQLTKRLFTFLKKIDCKAFQLIVNPVPIRRASTLVQPFKLCLSPIVTKALWSVHHEPSSWLAARQFETAMCWATDLIQCGRNN